MRIDPHVHCRDGRQAYKETITHVLEICDEQGVDVICDMPNTEPPILGESDMAARLALVPREAQKRYRLYLGVTADEKQVREASRLVNECYQVVGLKLYAGKSTGNLAVTSENDQKMIYQVLADSGYRGLLAVHCEKESLCPRLFNPQKPISHCAARPPEAETASITDQVSFARESKFQGTLHICHITTSAALEVVKAARRELHVPGGITISCGVTPHHLLWAAPQMQRPEGLLYKVNPPLRDLNDNIALRRGLKDGAIDWLESDHAPHPISEKLYPPYASGYPSLCLYRSLVEDILPYWGLTEDTIRNVTCHNIKRIIGERKF